MNNQFTRITASRLETEYQMFYDGTNYVIETRIEKRSLYMTYKTPWEKAFESPDKQTATNYLLTELYLRD